MTTKHSRTVQTRRKRQKGKKTDARIAKQAKKLRQPGAKAGAATSKAGAV
jgi:hypothetical protein